MKNRTAACPSERIEPARLKALQGLLCERADDLVAALRCGLTRMGKAFVGPCPVHGGDRATACHLYHSGEVSPGHWQCFTRGCQKHFQSTALGFVRGVLSHQEFGWERPGDPSVGFRDAVDWCCDWLKVRLGDLDAAAADLERERFCRMAGRLSAAAPRSQGVPRSAVRARLGSPDYFLGRGYSPEVLDRFDVGACVDPSRPFYQRVVVPVYCDEGRLAVGFTARSVFEACGRCGLYHDPAAACPEPGAHGERYCKWRNSAGFRRESHLYNWWNARRHIDQSGVVVLCEGPGDVWRLEEAGVRQAVALFGVSLTDPQQVLLESSGAMTAVVLLDGDEAGRSGRAELCARLSRCYRLVTPELPGGVKDVGELSVSDAAALVGPLVQHHHKRF